MYSYFNKNCTANQPRELIKKCQARKEHSNSTSSVEEITASLEEISAGMESEVSNVETQFRNLAGMTDKIHELSSISMETVTRSCSTRQRAR